MAKPKKDLRRYPRADVNLTVEYSLTKQGPRSISVSHDLSASGVCFETDKTFSRGETLHLKFTIPQINRVIEADAIVVRSFEYEDKLLTAVEFTNISYDDFLTILDYSLALFEENNSNP